MENNLSDNQRRTICRVLFLLVCALPTFATIYFATHQRSADDWAQRLKAELGVETSIGVVETPRPGEMVFHHVKLFDNDGEVIFESPKARVTFGNENEIKFQNSIRINRKGLSHFLKEASGRLVRARNDLKPWNVSFNDVQIVDGPDPNFENQPFHLQNVDVGINNRGNRTRLTVSAAKLGTVVFSRNPGDVAPEDYGQFEFAINTDGNAIPCWLAKDWFPDLKQLGKQTQFMGLAGVNSRGGWSRTSLTGDFIRINPPYFAERAQSIFVNGLQLEGDVLHEGEAIALLDDGRQIDLKSFLPQPAEPIGDPIRDVFHRAFREVSSASVRR